MSEWHAIEALNESIDRTVKLLFRPFNLNLWLRLALVVFMLGLGGTTSQFTSRVGNLSDMDINFTKELVILIIAIIAVLIFVSLVLNYIAAVFNFVFIEALMEDRIDFTKGFKRNMGKGLSFFLFQLAAGVISMAIAVTLVLAGVFIGIKMDSLVVTVLLIAIGIVFFIIYIIVLSLLLSLTSDFVVPMMHFSGAGVISGWRKLYGLIKANLSQFVIYIMLKIAFGIISGMVELAVGLVVLIVIIIGAIILGGAAVLAWLGLTAVFPALEGIQLIALAIGIFALIVIALIVSFLLIVITLPIPVFFRYYSILFIRKLDQGIGGVTAEIKTETGGGEEEKRDESWKTEVPGKKPETAEKKEKTRTKRAVKGTENTDKNAEVKIKAY